MPRSSLVRALAAAALVALATSTSVTAQDADAVAKKATAELKAIQEKLAAGKSADDSDAPVLKQLRIDGFAAADDKLVVSGAFLDNGGKGAADERFGDAAKQVIVKHLKLDKAPPFNWEKVEVFGVPDAGGKVEAGRESPFVALQAAANAAAADGVYLTGNRFGPAGELVVLGSWSKDAQKTLTDLWTKGVLTTHKAVAAKKGAVSFAEVKALDAWPLAVPAARAALADSKDAALRRTRIDRVYFQYTDTLPKLIIAGVRIGEDKMTEGAVKAALEPLWADVVSKIPAAPAPEILNDLPDPAADVQAAVAEVRALDGVRVDVGAEFNKDGDVLLAGLKPDTGDRKAALTDVFKAVVGKKAGKGDATAPRYALLATSKVSTDAMRPLPLAGLLDDMRAWAKANKDDVRFRRLAFAASPAPFEKQYYSTAKDGGGLTLVYQATNDADLKATAAEFQRAFAKRFPKGLPELKLVAMMGGTPKADEPPAKGDAKEPLLPGLTDALRAMIAASRDLPQDQNPWFGVLLTRGYFDEQDRYQLIGVVDTAGQNLALLKQLEKMKSEPKWAGYFRDADGKELALVPPKLDVISMSGMVDRVKRVTPAYSDFDGVRIESAYYDEKLYLTFKAHAVGRVTPDVVGKLANLLVNDPKYAARVVRPEQPADPTIPRLPPKVRIQPLSGPAYPDDQVANFSLAYGSKLLSEAGDSKAAKAKAKQWLDVAMLHYPNESAVWFLSARYNQMNSDESKESRMELVKRDLFRVVDLEGPLAFNGPAQRKRRYEAAKDFQGPARADLEAMWLEAFREAKDGGKPITLAGK